MLSFQVLLNSREPTVSSSSKRMKPMTIKSREPRCRTPHRISKVAEDRQIVENPVIRLAIRTLVPTMTLLQQERIRMSLPMTCHIRVIHLVSVEKPVVVHISRFKRAVRMELVILKRRSHLSLQPAICAILQKSPRFWT